MATDTTYLTEALARMVALDKQTLSAYKVDAVPHFFHAQESFPYITHRLGDNTPDRTETYGSSEDFEANVFAVVKRIVIGHLTAGVFGGSEARLAELVPLIQNAYARNCLLTSAAYPAPMDMLDPAGVSLTRFGGLQILRSDGIGAQQVGCEFIFRVPFTIYVDQEY